MLLPAWISLRKSSTTRNDVSRQIFSGSREMGRLRQEGYFRGVKLDGMRDIRGMHSTSVRCREGLLISSVAVARPLLTHQCTLLHQRQQRIFRLGVRPGSDAAGPEFCLTSTQQGRGLSVAREIHHPGFILCLSAIEYFRAPECLTAPAVSEQSPHKQVFHLGQTVLICQHFQQTGGSSVRISGKTHA